MALVLVCLGWVVGLALASSLFLPWTAALLFLGAVAVAGILVARRWPKAVLPVLGLAALLLGMLRGGPTFTVPGDLHLLNGQRVLLRGVVADDPEPWGRQVRFRLSVRERSAGQQWAPVSGSAQVWVERQAAPLRYGDRLEVRGRLQPPPSFGDFDYRAYLANQGIGSVLVAPSVSHLDGGHGNRVLAWVYDARRKLGDSLDRSLPEPQASLSRALVLGQRGGLPEEVSQAFRDSGTAHILAISGMHVSVVLGLALAVSLWALGRRRAYLLPPLAAVWLYALLSGLSPSVTRAAIMGTAYLAALALGRPRAALPALALTAAVMLGLDPRLLGNVSFQLSFTAMAGLLLLTPLFVRAVESLAGPRGEGGPAVAGFARVVVAGVGASLGATIATLPLLAFNFHRVSLMGIPATLLVLPVLPGILAGAFATALVGLLSPIAAQVVAWVPWLLEGYMVGAVRLMAAVPGSVVSVGAPAVGLVWAYYGVLGVALVVASRRSWAGLARGVVEQGIRAPARPVARAGLLLGVGGIAALLWTAALAQPDGYLHVWFLDVGQGDAVLVRTPGGFNILVDGGPDPRATLPQVDRRLPFWDRGIDLAVLSHPHDDHLSGLSELARRGRLRAALLPPAVDQGQESTGWRQVFQARAGRVAVASRGTRVTTPDGVVLEVLGPPEPPLGGTSSDADNNAVVVRLAYGRLRVLTTGDMRREQEMSLLDQGLDVGADVLKVAHHGSDTSTSLPFLKAVSPSLAVVSVGRDNPYGHPSPRVAERLRDVLPPDRVLTTAEAGTIEVRSNGQRLWVLTSR